MTKLTLNFSLDELILSSTATRLGIDNTPPAEIKANLYKLAQGLELVRALLAMPMHIDSGYRCELLNKAVGGVPSSAHETGFAADFICPEFGSPHAIVDAISASNIKFDQLIVEANTWVHISFDPAMRGEKLTMKVLNGKSTYTNGVA